MRDGIRAILFDLDETLYRERRFALSGYAAVARILDARTGVPAGRIFRQLTGSIRRGGRATALQTLCAAEDWPQTWVPGLVQVIRTHTPTLQLPRESRQVLDEMRARWRVAIVTNGLPSVQRRKVKALGLEALVDAVIYAEEHGTGSGKPDPAPFLAAARALDVRPDRCIFVGDDPVRDAGGAARVGIPAILLQRGGEVDDHICGAAIRIRHLREVPQAARQLAERKGRALCA